MKKNVFTPRFVKPKLLRNLTLARLCLDPDLIVAEVDILTRALQFSLCVIPGNSQDRRVVLVLWSSLLPFPDLNLKLT